MMRVKAKKPVNKEFCELLVLIGVDKAERTLPSSNLKPLNELETSRLVKVVSPHKIERALNETPEVMLSRDLTAINDFLFYVPAEPLLPLNRPKTGKLCH